ncbi:MAG TPA: glycosyltransferase [Terriglobales bacterium]|nr:glycosyltransferase [Terriglobales bacterium]
MGKHLVQVTVAICTWNRSRLLDQTLSQMRKLGIPRDVEWEVLVVNNNCTDDTDTVIARHADALPIRRLFEPKPGLSHARNCAVEAAAGAWIIFTDDDVLVDHEWLASYANAMKSCGPSVAFLGGAIVPWFPESPDPALMKAVSQVRDGFCARAVPGDLKIARGSSYLPFGANFAIRLDASQNCRFDPAFGVVGTRRILGEECLFMMRLLDHGFEGRWVQDASVMHYVDPARLRRAALSRALKDAGRTSARAGMELQGRFRVCGLPVWSYRAIVEGALHLVLPLSWFTNRVRYYSAFRDFWYYSGYMNEFFLGGRNQSSLAASSNGRADR